MEAISHNKGWASQPRLVPDLCNAGLGRDESSKCVATQAGSGLPRSPQTVAGKRADLLDRHALCFLKQVSKSPIYEQRK